MRSLNLEPGETNLSRSLVRASDAAGGGGKPGQPLKTFSHAVTKNIVWDGDNISSTTSQEALMAWPDAMDHSTIAGAVVCVYCLVTLLTLCCSNPYAATAMFLVNAVAVILDLIITSGKDKHKSFASPCHRLGHDMVQLARSLCTTLVPACLAYFGGGAFYIAARIQPTAYGCSVADLADLARAGYFSFACKDGYVAADVQVGVPAWKTRKEIAILNPERESEEAERVAENIALRRHTFGGRRLQGDESPVKLLGRSPTDRYGFAAPIYTSQQALQRNELPVAWAVKAGQPVRWSQCPDSDNFLKTCGIFAEKFWHQWRDISIVPEFGSSWGMNITHFHPKNMLHAEHAVKSLFPARHISWSPHATFIIAEAPQEYFGSACTCFWIAVSLLCLGSFDRIARCLYQSVEACAPSEPAFKVVAQEHSQGEE
eukprot:TRINITY_DN110756_c0_g1_i1.p1 TRINITY_DN110756_c0_g1~~TRINITY_DN110756_c0_g1_i1.p1  ORF type:complete len:447 (+),score=85.81 TRINITY_DN110756_c0_g1_i1:56-1342(+)